MAKAAPALTSFNAGEWSSRMEGRVDLAKYPNACRELENFLPMVQGPLIKRSGTKHVSPVRVHSTETRLIPFEFGTEQAYVLEFGNGYVRVLKDSGHVLETAVLIDSIAATTPIEITTTGAHGYSNFNMVYVAASALTGINGSYFNITVTGATTFTLDGTASLGASAADPGTVARAVQFSTTYANIELFAIKYAQSADVLYLTHPSHPPRKISRTSHTAWTLEDIAFDAPPFSQENLDEDDYMIATAATGSVTLYSTGGHFTANHVGGYVKLAESVEGIYPPWAAGSGGAVAGTSFFQYEIEGVTFENGENIYAQYEGNLYRYKEDYGAGATGSVPPLHDKGVQTDGEFDWEYVNGGYGWAIITAVTSAYVATATVVREFGRTVFHATDAIEAVLATTPIRLTLTGHVFETGDVLFISGSTETTINDLTFTITRFDANTISLDGTTNAGASGAGGVAVRVRMAAPTSGVAAGDRKRKVNAIRWAFGAFSTERGYPTSVAFFEDRLWFGGTGSDPQGLWASRTGRYEDHLYTDQDDGALFLLLNTQQVNQIEWISAGKRLAIGTAGGEFIITGATEGPVTAGNVKADQHSYYGSRDVAPLRVESVTLFVQRSGRKLIEFAYDFDSDNYQGADLCVLAHHISLPKIAEMAWQQEPDRIVWCVMEDGTLAGLTYDRQQEVVGWHRHPLGGVWSLPSGYVESVAVIPHPDGDRDQVWFVVKRTVNGSTVRHVEYLEKTWLQGTAIADAYFVDAGATYSGASTVTITGLWHLIGQSVYALANGLVQGPFTVSSTGTITLTTAATKAHVGLLYEAVHQSMRLEGGAGNGTSQGKTKKIPRVVYRLEDVGQGFKYGPRLDLLEITAGTLVSDDTTELAWPGGGHEQAARLNEAHVLPTPCTLVGIFPLVDTQD